MSFLPGLIGFLGLLFLVAGIIGTVAPSLFKDKKTGKIPKRSELLVGGIFGSVIAFGVSAWLAPTAPEPVKQSPDNSQANRAASDSSKAESTTTNSESSQQQNRMLPGVEQSAQASEAKNADVFFEPADKESKQIDKPEFRIASEEFIKRYNIALGNLKTNNKVSLKSESDGFDGKFTVISLIGKRHIFLTLTANKKTNALQSVIFGGAGDGTEESGFSIMMGAIAVVMAIENPNMPTSKIKPIMEGLGFLDGKASKDEKQILTRNGVHYIFTLSDVVGAMLSAEPTEQQSSQPALIQGESDATDAVLQEAEFNVSDKSITSNGNLSVAADRVTGLSPEALWGQAQQSSVSEITKKVTHHIGKLIKLSGEVYTVEELSIDSTLPGIWTEVLLRTNNPNSPLGATTIEFLYKGDSSKINAGDRITCAGYFVGSFESQNAFGGTVEAVVLVGNHFQRQTKKRRK